jgi:hypothetical protein
MKRWIPVILFILVLEMLYPAPAYAVTALPDSTPTLHDMKVYRNLLVDDDFLLVVPYTMPYATPPDLGIDKTFIFRLFDVAGTTELGSILAFPYNDDGYGEGIVSFYFDDTAAPVWGANYVLRIDCNPAEFAAPTVWSFVLDSPAYSSFDDHDDNIEELRLDILEMGETLSGSWPVDLTEETDSGTVLSTYGERYFRRAIKSVQAMCPELFYVQVSNPDYTKRSWDTIFADALANTFSGTFVWDAMTGFAGLWTMQTRTAMGYVAMVVGLIFMAISVSQFQQVQQGFLDFALVLTYFTLAGGFSPVLHAIIAFLSVFLGGMVWFLNRA